ncbi:HAD hydrolase-like protein [Streptomyces sp. NPDC004393]|uniref:HAD hydrolase-like protein n=1 Tax=Streptomyces sp. NPDC004533 TaxID=3154278 RepID=UPI0033B82C8B
MAVQDVYVVGDTPLDVQAAQAANATAVAVASGHYTAQALQTVKPDHVLSSLLEPFPGL